MSSGYYLRNNDSLWAAQTFTQPKKTWDNRILTDFRRLNICIERKPFPLPRIGEAVQRLDNFKSATAMDLSQGFYSILINEESQKLYTTVLPWGKVLTSVYPWVSCVLLTSPNQ